MIRLWDTAGTLLAAHEPLTPPVRIPDESGGSLRMAFRVHYASAVSEALRCTVRDRGHLLVAVDTPGGVFRGCVIKLAIGRDAMTVEVMEFARESQISCAPPPQGSSTTL